MFRNQHFLPVIPIKNFRTILFVLIILIFQCTASVSAKNYYFSSSTGNDAYTSTQSQSTATPWKTIGKLNSFFSSLVAGDSILFKRGDVFYGTIIVSKSGIAGKDIILDAYGTGANPLISGFTTISSWTPVGNGVFQAAINTFSSLVNMITLNNTPQRMGRYPDADSANGGYLSYESFTDSTSITDSELNSAVNWTGAEVVIRKKLWVLDRCKIINHTGSKITYSNPASSAYDGTNNYGYFIQNDPRTLNQLGEWYFDGSKKIVQMYFGINTPSALTTKIATIDGLLNIGSNKFITVNNLSFEGSNIYGIYAVSSDYITVRNSTFTNLGGVAIYLESTSDILIENINTYNVLSNAIWLSCNSDSNAIIRNCSIVKTGAIRGMGGSGGNSYKGILADLNNNLVIEKNRVDTTGYVGIEFDGSNVLVKNNYVNYFCCNKDDAGGIYSWTPGTDAAPAGNFIKRVVTENIVMNGVGAPEGRSNNNPYVSGIYLDGRTMNVDIIDNSVFNIGKNGIHCNNPAKVNIIGNTSFNNLNAVSFMRWPWGSINNLTVKNNLLYPKYSTQRNLYYTNAALNEPVATTVKDAIQSLGMFDSNYYSTSNETGFNYEIYSTSGGSLIPVSAQSLDAWKLFSTEDALSNKPIREAPLYLLNGTVGNNLFANGQFTSGISGITQFGTNTTVTWDNTSKISGGSLRVDFSAPAANKYVLLHSAAGAVSSSKKYVFRFTTLGTTAYGIVRAYIRKTASPYNNLTPLQVESFGVSARVHEFVFAAPVTEAGASFVIEVEQNSGTTYIDNVELYEATASIYNIDNYLRIEYNANTIAKTVSLGANYVGADGTYYPGTITLQPFSSKILVKDTAILRQALAAQSSATLINCFGGAATITVTATGGIPPYTGTGTFTMAAGSYTYTVKDLTGASTTTTVTVTQPLSALKVAAAAGTITVAGGTTSVTVTASGGLSPYTGTGTFTGIAAGTYTYIVKDAKGCSASVTLTVSKPAASLSATVSNAKINCFGGTATVTVTATGGKIPYTGAGNYTINAGRSSLKINFPVASSTNVSSLYYTIGSTSAAKNYILRFSTAGTASTGNFKVAIRQTNSPWATITAKQTGTYGTARKGHEFIFTDAPDETAASFLIEINQNSGTTYIDNIAFFEAAADSSIKGANLYTTGSFEAGISNIFAYSSNANQVMSLDTTSKISGTYYYVITDAAGASVTSQINTAQPVAPLQISVAAGAIIATGGTTTVTVSATGGTTPYIGTGAFGAVKAGTYTYQVTDANGCINSKTINITQPAARMANSVIAGIQQTKALNVTAYPNPSASSFQLLVENGSTEKIKMMVMNVDGKIVYRINANTNKRYSFGESLATGVYIVQVIQGAVVKTLKLIKIK